jgi:hypothetical protein
MVLTLEIHHLEQVSVGGSNDTRLVDLLLALRRLQAVIVSGDGVLQCAQGVASGLIEVVFRVQPENYVVGLTEKSRRFVERWEAGDEEAAIESA